MQTHLPEWIPLFREKLEVFVCELQRWESVELQVRPRMKKGGQVDKRVKTQPIIAIVREVGHKYTDLGWRNRDRGVGKKKWREGNTYYILQNCAKVKILFPKLPFL